MSLDPMPDAATLLRMKEEREARARVLAKVSLSFHAEGELRSDVARVDDFLADARDEKRVVAAADKQLRALGFVVVNLSQSRASKITPGVPDRLYMHPARGVALWWEAKTATGRQRPDQRQFQEWCDACDWPYVLGTDAALFGWLQEQGIAAEEDGLLVPLPYRSPESRSA
jgi:hypothetical protein